MRLYLLRHGKAVHKDEERTRPLTGRGERQVIALGRRMSERDLKVDRVFHSPKLRARQTAELFCQEALPDKQLELVDWMLPGDDYEPWAERFQEEEENLLLVGHNFFLELLAERLTGKHTHFKTSTLGAFERSPEGEWTRLWVEYPVPEPG